jgi:VIT1/CCC1 family predicted Fe2+/Mn2+ transporter
VHRCKKYALQELNNVSQNETRCFALQLTILKFWYGRMRGSQDMHHVSERWSRTIFLSFLLAVLLFVFAAILFTAVLVYIFIDLAVNGLLVGLAIALRGW